MQKQRKSLCVENVVEEMKNKVPECGEKQLKEQSRSENSQYDIKKHKYPACIRVKLSKTEDEQKTRKKLDKRRCITFWVTITTFLQKHYKTRDNGKVFVKYHRKNHTCLPNILSK